MHDKVKSIISITQGHSRDKSGLTALPTLIIISGILIEIVIAISLFAYLLSTSLSGAKFSAQAYIVARAGLQDANMRLARDKEYENLVGYNLNVGDNSANVIVDADNDCGGYSSGKHCITVTGTAGSYSKKIQVVLGVNDITGELVTISYSELEL